MLSGSFQETVAQAGLTGVRTVFRTLPYLGAYHVETTHSRGTVNADPRKIR